MKTIPGSFLRRLWRDQVWPFSIVELDGDCMAPIMTERHTIVDIHGEIRTGDLFSFSTRDCRTAFPRDIAAELCKTERGSSS
jgi:hypothetical protein